MEVELTGTSFLPADITVAVGTTVRWIYRSGGPHTVTPDGHTRWNEVSLTTAGQTFEHTFTTAGVFNYYCSPHRAAGITKSQSAAFWIFWGNLPRRATLACKGHPSKQTENAR